MTTRTRSIIGWTPAVLVGLFLIVASAAPKLFMGYEGSSLQPFTTELGLWDIILWIGLLELACAVLFLIPRTSTVGVVLMTGLLGGAMATGFTHPEVEGIWPWFPLVILGLVALSAYFRSPELLSRLLKRPVPSYGLAWRIIGWVLALPVALMNLFAAYTKFVPAFAGEQGAAFAQQVGMAGIERPLGVVEIIVTVLFLIPRTSTIGFIMMVGYMGGVLAANLSHGFGGMDLMPIYVMFVLLTLSGYLRNPELASRLLGKPVPAKI